jgi:hypothetical protein
MPLKKAVFCLFALCISFLPVALYAAQFTVAKNGTGTFSTVQAAVNAAKSGDEVVILDGAVYEEMVTIEYKSLTLRSMALGRLGRPTLRYKDTVHTLPHTCEDAVANRIDYDQNGALRILHANGFRVDGIKIDAGEPFVFGGDAIWPFNEYGCGPNNSEFLHGNAGLVVKQSAKVIVRNCEFLNGFYGVFIKDRNTAGACGMAYSSTVGAPEPGGFARTGNHLFEGNLFHHNVYGLGVESAHGLATTLRNNVFHENHHPSPEFATVVKAMADGGNFPGGALFFKDVPYCPWFIEQNTFYHNYLILSGHWRIGAHHVLSGNIIGQPYVYRHNNPIHPAPYAEMTRINSPQSHGNVFANQEYPPHGEVLHFNSYGIDSLTQTSWTYADSIEMFYPFEVWNGFPKPKLVSHETTFVFIVTGHMRKSLPQTYSTADVLGFLDGESMSAIKGYAVQENRWWEAAFASDSLGSPHYLRPRWPDNLPALMIDSTPFVDYGDKRGRKPLPGQIPDSLRAATSLFAEPLDYALVKSKQIEFDFDLQAPVGISDLKVVAATISLRGGLSLSAFGGDAVPMPRTLALPTSPPVQPGLNRWVLSLADSIAEGYGSVNFLISGVDANGAKVYSNRLAIPHSAMGHAQANHFCRIPNRR